MNGSWLAILLAFAPCACSSPAHIDVQPLGPLPTKQQLEWQALGRCAFAHFGVDTFTDAEWGTGTEPESVFNPTDFDARQWVAALKESGFRGLILTAKHHDGFCLWPSKFSEHTVARSPWKNGQGDVVREVADACREAGLKFGVYLSPWDRHEPSYGDSPRYNQHYVDQLTELLTNYGPIFEVWWDGACGEGPNGKKQEYDWARFREVVRTLQPDAVIFSDVGPDVRWVGNENGFAGETCWGMISPEGKTPGSGAPSEQELNEGLRDGTHWIPPECDVSIRPGWFHHASQDGEVKSVRALLDIWYASVGRGANLLLNVPPDRRGRLHENDVARLREFDGALKAIFARDLAHGHAFERLADGCRVDLGGEVEANHLVLREDLALGQRVARFRVLGELGTRSFELVRGTTIGHQRVLRFPTRKLSRVQVIVEDSRAAPVLAGLELYDAPPEVAIVTRERDFMGALDVALATDRGSALIRYTLDGSEPGPDSPVCQGHLHLDASCTLRARAFQGTRASLFEARADFRNWRVEDLLPAVQFIRRPDAGLARTMYAGARTSLADLSAASPAAVDNVSGFDVSDTGENIACAFRGSLDVPADGLWKLATESDDGSRLYVDGRLVVDNDGVHAMQERSGTIGLKAGWHTLELQWFNAGGNGRLLVGWSGPGTAAQSIPAERLGH